MENIEALAYPLPEDIEKLKWFGDFQACRGLIEMRLREDIPETLKEKLRMELVQLRRMERSYTVTPEQALQTLTENIMDFQPQELEQLRRENVLDWIFVNGQVRYIDDFYENLIKIRLDIRARQKQPEQLKPGEKTSGQIRDEIICMMKSHSAVTCRMKIRAEIRLGEELLGKEGTARVYLPLPLEFLQSKNVRLLSASPKIKLASSEKYPQRTVLFEGTPQEVCDCRIEYSVENTMRYVELKPEEVSKEQPSFFLHEQLPHISFTPYLKALTEEIVGDETNPLRKARRIYDFITTKVNYSYMRSYISLPVIPEYCAARLRGDCGVQALTFITMCRIAGVPARWQSGRYADAQGTGCHDWAVFYVAPYGWLWADCSFGGAAWREGETERWDFYFGNMDPYRIVLASEFQQPFDPPMKYLRSDPYDNQSGEVELEDGPVETWAYQSSAQVLELELSAE